MRQLDRSTLLAQRALAGNATRIRFLDTGATTLPPAFFSDTPRTVSGSFFDLAGGSFGAACRAVVVRGNGPDRIVTERDDAASVWLLAECMRVRLGMPHEVPASEASQETAAALDPFTLRVIGDLVAEARRGLPLQGEGGLPIAMVRLLRALDALTTAPEGPPRVRASIRQSALRQSAIHCCAPVPGAPHTDSAGK